MPPDSAHRQESAVFTSLSPHGGSARRRVLILAAVLFWPCFPDAFAQQPESAQANESKQVRPLVTADGFGAQAEALVRQGAYRAALPFALQALQTDLRNPGPDSQAVIADMQFLGRIYRALSMPGEAQNMYAQALAAAEKSPAPDPAMRAQILQSLADLHSDAGDLDKAMSFYLRALHIQERTLGPSHPETATAQISVAGMHVLLGQYEQARPLVQEALNTLRRQLGQDAAPVIDLAINLYRLENVMGGKNDILPLLQKKLAMRERTKGAVDTEVADTLTEIAHWHRLHGSLQQALQNQLRAIEIDRATLRPEHASAVSHQLRLAMIYLAMDDAQRARPLLVNGFGTEAVARDPWMLKYAAQAMGDMYAKEGNGTLEIFFYKLAANTMQGLRLSSGNMLFSQQEDLFRLNAWGYQRLARKLFRAGRDEEGRKVFAMLREIEYRKLVQPERTQQFGLLQPVAYSEAESPWSARLQTLFAENRALASPAGRATAANDEQAMAEIAGRRSLLREQGVALIGAMEAALPDAQSRLAAAEATRHKEAQARLQAQAGEYESHGRQVALVAYRLLGDTLRISVTRERGTVVREVRIPQDVLIPAIRAFRKTLENPSLDPRPISVELHAILIKPVSAELKGVTTLMLSPDGALRYMPFGALYDGNRYLIEDFSLSVQAEGRIPAWTGEPASGRKIALFGMTKASEGFPALPGVRMEVQGIASRSGLRNRMFLDQKFTSEKLKSSLQENFSYLHIASHFQLSGTDDVQSFLLLGDGSRLSLQDLQRGGYRFDRIDLLTLSACATALPAGLDAEGDAKDGLGELAQKLGAKSVIATLWAINDAGTNILMQQLYGALAGHHAGKRIDKARALQQAQLALLGSGGRNASTAPRGYAHPYYWSAFVLMGNWQ